MARDSISEFIETYPREVDFYAAAARVVEVRIATELRNEGIRAIVSSRAKRVDGVESKLRKRVKTKSHEYPDVESIRNDLVDLAGVRVALYFPGQREKTDDMIKAAFEPIRPPKKHPEKHNTPPPLVGGAAYEKRFAGYCATHHVVRIFASKLAPEDLRLSRAQVEIQVGSVLMHGWAEVEHDLVYKPLSGALSEDEVAILDEINGLVIAGEIALGRLESARDRRLAQQTEPFESSYDLAAFLFNHVRKVFSKEAGHEAMGSADRLFKLIEHAKLNSPNKIAPLLDDLKPTFEKRPIAEQIIDRIIAGDTALYEWFTSLSPTDQLETSRHRAQGRFLEWWAILEHALDSIPRMAVSNSFGSVRFSYSKIVDDLVIGGHLRSEVAHSFQSLRRFRNAVVHSATRNAVADLDRGAEHVRAILEELAGSSDPVIRAAAEEALRSMRG